MATDIRTKSTAVARRIGGRTKRYSDFQRTEANQSDGKRERYGTTDDKSPSYRRGAGVGRTNEEAGRNDSISARHGDQGTDLSALKQSRRNLGTMTTRARRARSPNSDIPMRGRKP